MRRHSLTHQTGIYFLKLKGVVIYVGQSTRYPQRLYYHDSVALYYDEVKFIPCDAKDLDEKEQMWIHYFKPMFNKTHNCAQKIKVKTKIVSTKHRMKFRRLTKLSRLDFGPHKERTVEEMLGGGRKLDLIKIYYTLSHISFCDDLLKEFGLVDEWVIVKPGVDKDKFFEFAHKFYPEKMIERQENYARYHYRESKKVLAQAMRGNASKSYNQSFNQRPK